MAAQPETTAISSEPGWGWCGELLTARWVIAEVEEELLPIASALPDLSSVQCSTAS